MTQRKWESKGSQNLRRTNPRGFKIYKEQIQGGSKSTKNKSKGVQHWMWYSEEFEALESQRIWISEEEHLEAKFRGVWNFKKSSLGGGGGYGSKMEWRERDHNPCRWLVEQCSERVPLVWSRQNGLSGNVLSFQIMFSILDWSFVFCGKMELVRSIESVAVFFQTRILKTRSPCGIRISAS